MRRLHSHGRDVEPHFLELPDPVHGRHQGFVLVGGVHPDEFTRFRHPPLAKPLQVQTLASSFQCMLDKYDHST